MGFIIFIVIVYCIFYAIPKLLYRDALQHSNNDPLVAILSVIMLITLFIIVCICLTMSNKQLGAYILLGIGVILGMLTIYTHWYNWKEKSKRKDLENHIQNLIHTKEKYREALRTSAKRRIEAKNQLTVKNKMNKGKNINVH